MKRKIIKRKSYSKHEGDWYLEIVLAEIDSAITPYVTWLYNKEDGGFHSGNYFETLEEAEQDFNKRGSLI